MDEHVPEAKRAAIVEAVQAGLADRSDLDLLVAVVTSLPNGRLTVYVNQLDDPALIARLEEAVARLR